MDITLLYLTKKWSSGFAWGGYLLAARLLIYGILFPPLLLLIGGLFIFSFMMTRANPTGASMQFVLIFIYTVSSLILQPEYLPGPILSGGFLVMSLLGLIATIYYRRLLPPENIDYPPENRAGWLPRKISDIKSGRYKQAIPYAFLSIMCMILTIAFILIPLIDSLWNGGWLVLINPALGLAQCLTPLLLLIAYYFWTRAKRIASLSGAQAREMDRRPPLLLLRSFSDDLTPIKRSLPFTMWQPTVLYRGAWTLEEAVEKVLERYGPVIAIGRPGEKIPPAGFARSYVSNDEWQERVKEYISESQKVIVLLGNTEGLQWEYRQLAEMGAWEKMIVLFPPAKKQLSDRWKLFWEATAAGNEAEPSAIPKALAAVFSKTGEPQFVTTGESRKDEETYKLAIRAAFSINRGSDF